MIKVRVLYRPLGRNYWEYGWSFHTETLDMGRRTVQRVTGRRLRGFGVSTG